MRPSTFLLTTVLGATSTLAHPTAAPDLRTEDLQCRCISTTPSSFTAGNKPTLCTYISSHAFPWSHASSLSSEYDIPILFASQSTISRLDSITRPLPDSLRDAVSRGGVVGQEDEGVMQRVNRVVCGFEDEFEEIGGMDDEEDDGTEELHFVGWVVASVMGLVVIYLGVEWVWMRFMKQGSIKLEGEEKVLVAEYEVEKGEGGFS